MLFTLLEYIIGYIYMIFDTTKPITIYTKYDACNTDKIGIIRYKGLLTVGTLFTFFI